jgi:hypothetical protein
LSLGRKQRREEPEPNQSQDSLLEKRRSKTELILSYHSRSSDYSNYTTAAIEDELVKQLHCKRKYLEQAERLIYRINIFNPLPVFVISERDISRALANALDGLGSITMKSVITHAVRRLYESVDFDYYHTSGIYGKVKWGFDD